LFPSGPPNPPPQRSGRDLVAALYRQAGLVAGCALAATAVSMLLYAHQPRLYTSSAKVWVQTEQQGSPSFLSGIAAYRETPYPDPVNRKIETEIELMLTRANAQAVVEKLQIRDEQLARGGLSKLRAELAGKPAPAPPPESPPDPGAVPGARSSRTVDLFLDGVSVEPLRSKTADTSSNVLGVSFECADPALAPAALQAFLENYLQLGAQQNRHLGETTSRVIESQLEEAKRDLRESEDRIVSLLARDGGRAAGGVDAATGTAALASASGMKLDLSPEATLGGGAATTVAALKQQTLELQQRLDEARQLYTDDAGNVRLLRAQLEDSRQRLARVVRDGAHLQADLGRLQRERELAQERFVELQRKLDQIQLYLRLNPTEAESRVVIDAPDHPTRAEGRKKAVVMLLGPVGGLLLGLLLAGLREMGGDRLRSAREVEWALGAPVLGAIPTLGARARGAYLARSAGATPAPVAAPAAPSEPS
jgi:uncharacterized protein involved in exopolysaccharide biosynthesis